uniref:Dynamin-type G domain-containing protein n=1 Tax=Aureoumbra lagunensis TaxID=44058 RepID=A0A7S3JVN6_9STRA|mmetsp:Transcript_19770/g.30045  ORF Transcript_19770/g.30045 Transcript_19770/m.30045 type:complete len:779 (+) Transcript_19770:51-2387(+)|eukprot:CAMPEP_0197307734 /NCGR_PEP_ID=MMETSP0891-20130614/5702_1 /TAXON_ID=44058 ORGANISM="Aureoumbra lagunensis, Strain CCMP1510" /NCGR_SAMPLE_ID=MMETSP0891 /ASSEMBLY_ACC=CAM_ASM_000534 /LENGTH=778 /DNA_ID=CAMNT_0042791435 /DNA_START=34 /DNA_END=2370 /DNA_ORIENTATION=-
MEVENAKVEASARAEENIPPQAPIDLTYRDQVRPWLELAEDLRTLNLDSTLAVPQICVMGDQSSGKSSVLEALSGIPFPRGSGLVTRCPVRLVMRRADSGTRWQAVASLESSQQSVSAESAEELTNILARLMEASTRQHSSSQGGMSTEAIVVKLTSADAPDLTVVDLPGIVRTTTAGQSINVIDEVNGLIDSYLQEERTIILAVIPANQDIATVDILERAQRVDPKGERTLGVLTKPDLVGDGNEEEVIAVVKNERKPLKLGYVMVKNRSQAQIKQGTSSEIARQDEARFFSSHPIFKKLSQNLVGVHTLTTALTKLLVTRIQTQLAPMKRQVEQLYGTVRTELRRVATRGTPTTPGEQQKLLITITQDFIRQLHDCVRGEYRDRLIVTSPTLRLYTRALVIFQELQSQVVATAPRFKDRNFVDDLAKKMESLRGRELPGFMSAQSFYMFIQDFIEAWRGPTRAACGQTRALAAEVVADLLHQIAPSYPVLRDAFDTAANSILEQTEDEAITLIDSLLLREKDPFTINEFLQAHINKLRYDKFETAVDSAFAGDNGNASWDMAKQHVINALRTWYQNSHSVSSAANAEDLSAILQAYWTLASKRYVDNACMAIDDRILGTLCPKLQEALFHHAHDNDKLDAFFVEDPAIVAKRKELEATKDRLAKATLAMSSIQVTRTNKKDTDHGAAAATGSAGQLIRVTIPSALQGLGLQLADEQNRVVVRGFRDANSPAQDAGIHLGDTLVQINERPVTSFDNAISQLKALNKQDPIHLVLRRL